MTRKKPVPIPDADTLRAAALDYLARHAAGSADLRRVLLARILRAARAHPDLQGDPARLACLRQEVENVVAECLQRRHVDDDAFAAMKARRGRTQGKSAAALAAKLRARGLTKAQVAGALADVDGGDAGAELAAARLLARRRRLGRFRKDPAADDDRHRRDLGILARAGFSRAVALQALETADDEGE